jgi:hypothetical protein
MGISNVFPFGRALSEGIERPTLWVVSPVFNALEVKSQLGKFSQVRIVVGSRSRKFFPAILASINRLGQRGGDVCHLACKNGKVSGSF